MVSSGCCIAVDLRRSLDLRMGGIGTEESGTSRHFCREHGVGRFVAPERARWSMMIIGWSSLGVMATRSASGDGRYPNATTSRNVQVKSRWAARPHRARSWAMTLTCAVFRCCLEHVSLLRSAGRLARMTAAPVRWPPAWAHKKPLDRSCLTEERSRALGCDQLPNADTPPTDGHTPPMQHHRWVPGGTG